MFEDSLMESQNRLSSRNQRWTTAFSMALQCSVVGAIFALPLLHPDALLLPIEAPRVTLPLKSVQPPRVEAVSNISPASSGPVAAHPLTRLTLIRPLSQVPSDAAPSPVQVGSGMVGLNGISEALATSASGSGLRVSVASASPGLKGPLHVSTGISAGLLLAPIKPIYPRIAISARVEGAVKVEAIISTSGHIESAHVISGPEMLRQAAIDAIRNARYKPYELNGSLTAVETTITVNFKLSD